MRIKKSYQLNCSKEKFIDDLYKFCVILNKPITLEDKKTKRYKVLIKKNCYKITKRFTSWDDSILNILFIRVYIYHVKDNKIKLLVKYHPTFMIFFGPLLAMAFMHYLIYKISHVETYLLMSFINIILNILMCVIFLIFYRLNSKKFIKRFELNCNITELDRRSK